MTLLQRFRARDTVANTDAGFTLVELLVSMSILIVVLGIFTDAFLSVQKGVRKTNSLATAQQQARTAFQLLDRTARYANAVNAPTSINGSQYLEFELGDLSATTNLQQTCYQWRVNASSQLQWRTFTVPSPSAAAGTQSPLAPQWHLVAPRLDLSQGAVFSTDPTSAAFANLEPSSAGAQEMQIAFQLRVLDGTNPGARASTQALFTAADTSLANAPGQVTVAAGGTFPNAVCQQAGQP